VGAKKEHMVVLLDRIFGTCERELSITSSIPLDSCRPLFEKDVYSMQELL
jgi:hypothetical protein